jgi:hypothetical protein
LVDADANAKKSSFLTSTVVGVGLGGKTCISVNDESRHKNDAAATSVKIWTSTSATNTDVSTTFVQTTAIVHPTPQT